MAGSVTMAPAMGMAGSRGMLRRTLYEGMTYRPYTLVAIAGGVFVSIGFLTFLINFVGTLGLWNMLSLFVPERWLPGP